MMRYSFYKLLFIFGLSALIIGVSVYTFKSFSSNQDQMYPIENNSTSYIGQDCSTKNFTYNVNAYSISLDQTTGKHHCILKINLYIKNISKLKKIINSINFSYIINSNPIHILKPRAIISSNGLGLMPELKPACSELITLEFDIPDDLYEFIEINGFDYLEISDKSEIKQIYMKK